MKRHFPCTMHLLIKLPTDPAPQSSEHNEGDGDEKYYKYRLKEVALLFKDVKTEGITNASFILKSTKAPEAIEVEDNNGSSKSIQNPESGIKIGSLVDKTKNENYYDVAVEFSSEETQKFADGSTVYMDSILQVQVVGDNGSTIDEYPETDIQTFTVGGSLFNQSVDKIL